MTVFGVRVHEWHLGAAGLAGAGLASALGAAAVIVALLVAVSLWLIAKDWRDLVPATRDTAAWAPGIHRPPGLQTPRGDAVPAVAALATAAVGLRWQPRYLLFEKPTALPRTALAAMWAEGQLPKPALPRPQRRTAPVELATR